jgi:hypothetical protein
MYVVGAAASQIGPNVGDSAAAYTNALTTNTDIPVISGQHIFIVKVDGSLNILEWVDVTTADGNIHL